MDTSCPIKSKSVSITIESSPNCSSITNDFYFYYSTVKVSCRVSEELPWLLCQAEDRENLKNCVLDMFVFQKMYAR